MRTRPEIPLNLNSDLTTQLQHEFSPICRSSCTVGNWDLLLAYFAKRITPFIHRDTDTQVQLGKGKFTELPLTASHGKTACRWSTAGKGWG